MSEIKFPHRIEISARHVHLSLADFKTLFGADAAWENVKELSVQGEFKTNCTVTIVGPKRNLERVAVLGPWREQTQVEISLSDSYFLGIPNVPCRLSGDLVGSSPVQLVGPRGTLSLSAGLIIAMRHIHVDQATMQKYHLAVGQALDLTTDGPRGVTFHNVIVRESAVTIPVVHLDTDEGNAMTGK